VTETTAALARLAEAAHYLRCTVTADPHTDISEVTDGVQRALSDLWAIFADYDGNPLYERNQALFDTEPERAAWLDAQADELANNLEPLVGDAKPELPGPDGTRRASIRSSYRLFGWPGIQGRRS
jgi:hypothetical protein